MNERIKELAEQAGLKWKAQPPHYTNTNNPIDFPVSANRDLEKFAELIVKDVRWVMQTAADDFILDKNYDAVKGVGRCMRRVKQHFGVEE
jgi:UDP:flavonoid glycosyltransferase YjiC (YdhE family)